MANNKYLGRGDGPEELELAKIALHIQSGYFPRDREGARRAFADLFESECRESGVEPSPWMDRLREEPWEG